MIFFVCLSFINPGCRGTNPIEDTSGNTGDVSPWSAPVQVTSSAGFNSYNVSMNKNGLALMAYSRWDDSNGRDTVFAKSYDPESGWGDDVPVDAGSGMGDAYHPYVAWDISGSGDAFVIFTQGDGTNDRVYVRRYLKDSGWENKVTLLSVDGGGKSGAPRIAFDSSGNAMAVFTQGNKLYANRFDVSSSVWSGTVMISYEKEGDVQSPGVIFNGNGQFVVSFYQHIITQTPNRTHLFVTGFDGYSWWPVPVQVDTDYHNYFEEVMGADGFGNLMIAFSEGADNSLYVKRYVSGLGWEAAKKLGISSGKPVSIAYDISHNASVLFVQDENGSSHVYSSGYTSSTDTWSEPVAIDGTGSSSANNPHLIFDSLNHAIAIYSKVVDGVPHIFSARFDWSSGWQTPERIDGNGVLQSSVPEIVMDWDGNALILYAVPDPGSGQIYAVRYTSGVQ